MPAPTHQLKAGTFDTVVIPVVLALVLLVSLAPLPHAAMLSNHPWRAELCLAIFLSGVILLRRTSDESSTQVPRSITLAIAAFALWGLLSALWAHSAAAAWHHTILWGEYLLTFLWVLSLGRIRRVTVVTTFGVAACFIAGLAAVDYLTLTDFASAEGTLRMRYGAYGELLLTGIPLLWLVAAYRRNITRWIIALIPAAAGWTAAMLSLSKGVFMAGVGGCSLAFLAALIFGRGRRTRIAITAAAWVLLTFAVQAGSSYLTPAPTAVDYVSGKAETNRESSIARVFMWKVGAVMAREHRLTGVGADNFGVEFNNARALYRTSQPDEPASEINGDYLAERAHNEPLQVAAELGSVGIALFALPFAIFAFISVRRMIAGWRPSLVYVGAVGGMAAFAMSSLVSSFSFRIVQNGAAFFLIFAIAVAELTRHRCASRTAARLLRSPSSVVFLAIAVITLGLKAGAEYSFVAADGEGELSKAVTFYQRSVRLDPDYAAALYRIGSRGCDAKFYGAAADLRRSIDDGMGTIVTYSRLADCYEEAGDRDSSLATLERSLRVFPRSVFLLVRHSLQLEKAGRTDLAASELDRAKAVDLRAANGWLSLMTRGSVRSFYDAQTDPELSPPAELTPKSAVLLYLDKPPGEQPE